MSEFCASSDFLGKMHFYVKYYSLINSINTQEFKLNSMIFSLRRYHGFGIENQIRNLKTCKSKLSDYKSDVQEEFNSLMTIVDTINDSEKKAVGILGDISNDYTFDGYDSVGSEAGYTGSSFSKIYKEFLDAFAEIGNDSADIFGELFDFFGKSFNGIKSAFKDYLAPVFNALDIIKSCWDICEFVSDGKISFSDFMGIGDGGISIIKDALKIYDNIKDAELYDKVSPYLSVAAVGVTTIYSGAKTYDRVSADGVVDLKDWGEIGIDASVDGLYDCTEALVIAACPPAAIGVAIFELINFGYEKATGTSIKDKTKESIKQGCEDLADLASGIAEDVSNGFSQIKNALSELMGYAVPA